MKFLVVDDSECWRLFVKSLFESNHTVVECEDGAQALTAYVQHQPDWVLMDVHMPRVDGLTAARQIKAQFPSARIVFVSQFADAGFRSEAEKIGADGYVFKEDFLQVFPIIHSHAPKPPPT
ncbi:MAG: response regulator transcription factor [Verrucomicrobia bacterium]|nr:response regulator transcription factor [Verrucomicrobiota bacterium]